jgi:hypothetical protein
MLFGQRHGCNEGNLVLRAAPDLATSRLTAEVGINDLDFAFKLIAIFTVGQHRHPRQPVLYQTSSWVTHAQLAFQYQGRQSRLGLTIQVDRQKPNRQWQFGILKHRSGNQRSLMSTTLALKDLAGTSAHNVIGCVNATPAAKIVRPANRFQRLLALRFVTVTLQKLRHRQPMLKLNSIHCHSAPLQLSSGVTLRSDKLTR